MTLPTPVWEHGYRCHGYWIGITRVGWVSIGPRPNRVEITGHSWGVVHPVTGGYIEGRCLTLRRAKRAVEKKYREVYNEKPPAIAGGVG